PAHVKRSTTTTHCSTAKLGNRIASAHCSGSQATREGSGCATTNAAHAALKAGKLSSNRASLLDKRCQTARSRDKNHKLLHGQYAERIRSYRPCLHIF